MKQKQRIALLGILAVALIFAACDGDSGNNSTETEGDSSSSVVKSSSSSAGVSGSSVVVSSSSVKAQSSSSVTASVVDPSTVISGTMTDSRDGRIYKTVKIGTQTWMAENLNYDDSAAMTNLEGNSWCYENSADSCAKYGRLYTWTGAMNIDSSYTDTTWDGSAVNHQGVCPVGWHIPTYAEWEILQMASGGRQAAGKALKSTSGWYNGVYDNGSGTDSYGFSALPSGIRSGSGEFLNVDKVTHFWSSMQVDRYAAFYSFLDYSYVSMSIETNGRSCAYSVRCLKN